MPSWWNVTLVFHKSMSQKVPIVPKSHLDLVSLAVRPAANLSQNVFVWIYDDFPSCPVFVT